MSVFWVVLGIGCLCYFIAMAVLGGTGTWFFLLWGMMGAAFLLWGLLRRKILLVLPGWLKVMGFAAFLLVLLIFLIVEGCIISGFSRNTDQELDYIIVLGAQMKTSGPSRVLQYRLDAAYEYLTAHPNTGVIVSGGQGKNEPVSEAAGMYEYLVKKGISPDRIFLENQSVNTEQNIRFSKEFFDPQKDRVGIVTNNFHVFRAVRLAKAAGYQHVTGIAASATIGYLPNNMLREFFGVVKDFLMGHF